MGRSPPRRAPLQNAKISGPGEPVLGERQGANALAGDGENSVAHGGKNRREGGFSEAGG
jgi:hypothetical protein